MAHDPEYYAAWYAKNAERKRAQVKARYESERAAILAADRARRAANRDEINARRRAAYSGEKRQRVLAQVRSYQERNADAVRSRQRERYAANRLRMLEKSKEYRMRAAALIAARNLRRVAMKRQAVPAWAGELDRFIEIEAQQLAQIRESIFGLNWHVDHMIPLQGRKVCGLHVWNNLQVIPATLNISKGNKPIFTNPGEWIRHI